MIAGWLKRIRFGSRLDSLKREHKLHKQAYYYLSSLLVLERVVLPNHPGYNGVRDLLRDLKQPTETLERKKCNLECVLNIKPQSE